MAYKSERRDIYSFADLVNFFKGNKLVVIYHEYIRNQKPNRKVNLVIGVCPELLVVSTSKCMALTFIDNNGDQDYRRHRYYDHYDLAKRKNTQKDAFRISQNEFLSKKKWAATGLKNPRIKEFMDRFHDCNELNEYIFNVHAGVTTPMYN